ncbi:PREDICTED: nuclear transcription factor Y subunit B-8-like [Erythranthe guttata]|nr:PREDICTED: nuclear transcription factor Y subunit B-8-like [Erythranthe guttata]|eukprot:XP_012846005.1 PREDICTED: nuclear transcription factor Y subunit B-8-like [Erythranthe guttata]
MTIIKDGIVIREGGAPTPTAATNAVNIRAAPINETLGEVNQEQQQGVKREAVQYMPTTNITRIMRCVLPAHVNIADDAKEAIQVCVSEFINFVTAEANNRCRRDYRKTVTPEDVLAAMTSLGFGDYIEPLVIFLNKHRAQQDLESGSMNQLGLFVRRDDDNGGFVHHQQPQDAHMVQSPPPPAAPTMGYYVPLPPLAAGTVEDGEELGGSTTVNNAYMSCNYGRGEGSSGGPEFDPFHKF